MTPSQEILVRVSEQGGIFPRIFSPGLYFLRNIMAGGNQTFFWGGGYFLLHRRDDNKSATGCFLAVIKPISGCVRIVWLKLMLHETICSDDF